MLFLYKSNRALPHAAVTVARLFECHRSLAVAKPTLLYSNLQRDL